MPYQEAIFVAVLAAALGFFAMSMSPDFTLDDMDESVQH